MQNRLFHGAPGPSVPTNDFKMGVIQFQVGDTPQGRYLFQPYLGLCLKKRKSHPISEGDVANCSSLAFSATDLSLLLTFACSHMQHTERLSVCSHMLQKLTGFC